MTVSYSQTELCDYIAGGKSLVSWCKENNIGYSTITAHLAKDPVFQVKYAQAREAAADFHVDEVIAIADSEPDPAKARVRVDARKWVAAKMKPKKYGDKLNIGGQEDNPIKAEMTVRYVDTPAGTTEGVDAPLVGESPQD